MDGINQNKVNNTSFNGVPKNHEVKTLITMEHLIKNMVDNIRSIAETNRVPEYGDFSVLEERFKNINSDFCVDEFWLEIAQVPRGIENYKKLRGLRFCASKPHSDAALEILLASGSKEDVIEKLKDPALLDKLNDLTKKLSDNLRDL